MIKLERTSVMNFDNAFRGARNPLNSWAKADSYYDENGNFVIGEEDLKLALRLIKAGADERKFMRQIFVSVDITAPMYWWKEFDTYKVATVANSTSTMHKIHAKPIERADFSCDKLDGDGLRALDALIAYLEGERLRFVENKTDKEAWYHMIQLLPSSYNQMRTVTMNYENLIGMYYARRFHKLSEWHVFCDWVLSLPHADKLIAYKNEN
ncbi:MAG: hypothetical protein E7589_06440 [Ruminococcaceae bacterium]|nr:hypothetical protein [Oscillospiraceae bacterium]